MRLIGCSAMRSSTSRRYGFGIEAVELGGADQAVDAAARSPPASEPANR